MSADPSLADASTRFAEARTRRSVTDRHYRRLKLGLVLGDAFAAIAGVLIGLLIVSEGRVGSSRSLVLLTLAPLAVVSVFASHGLYRVRKLVPAQEFRTLFSAVSIGVIALAVLASVFVGDHAGREDRLSLAVGWIGVTWLILLVLVMIERKVWHRVVHRMRRSGVIADRTLILGADAEASEIARRLAAPGLGFRTVGMLVAREGERPPAGIDVPVLGTIDDLVDVVSSNEVSCLFVASSDLEQEEIAEVLQTARRMALEVRVSANLPDMLLSRLSMQTIGGKLALSLESASLSGGQAVVKRAFDIVVSLLSILITSPLWLLAAAMVKTTSRGPVFFSQERVGRHGHVFTILKFRTMVEDAEQRVEVFQALNQGQGPLFKVQDDPRLTRGGGFLRKWSIDELPQLLNVVKGDMSLVGPRPMPASFDRSHYEDWHLDRLEVLPGITGLWQVSGRSNLTFDECVQLDTFYIENWSVAYDLYILLKTIPAVIRRRGAM